MRERAKQAVSLAAAVLLAGVAGCSPKASRIQGPEAKLPANEGSPGFLDRLASQTTVCENDALRGMLLLLDGEDKAGTFQQRVEDLTERGILAGSWRCDAARPVTRGKLAYMVCQACKIRGGVIMHLTGPSQRYCLRELQHLQMMSGGTAAGHVTGMEFVAILSRADIYVRTGELPVIMEATGGGR
jgi:hypothetical protein